MNLSKQNPRLILAEVVGCSRSRPCPFELSVSYFDAHCLCLPNPCVVRLFFAIRKNHKISKRREILIFIKPTIYLKHGQFGRVVLGAGSRRQSARAWVRTPQLSLFTDPSRLTLLPACLAHCLRQRIHRLIFPSFGNPLCQVDL